MLGAVSWTLFQLAGSPYFVMVNIFVFSAYFQKVVVGDYVRGQVIWGDIQALAGLLVALCSPILGAAADAAGPRKPGLAIFSIISCLGMVALWFAEPGAVLMTGVALVICAVFMEFAFVYHNAMLPDVSGDHNVGWLSGAAFSMDYLGSVTLFLVWLNLPAFGLFGADWPANAHERSVGVLSAAWFAVFMIPLFVFTPDRPSSHLPLFKAIGAGLVQLQGTLRRVGHYRNIATYFVSRAIYADGMSGVFVFLAGFLGGTFGWSFEKIGLYALVVLTVPIFSSAIAGYIDDWIGSKRTIQISLFMFTLGVIGSLSTTPDEYLYFYPVTDDIRVQQIPYLGALLAPLGFTTFPEQLSLAFSMAGSAFVGPVLASSRTMVARLSPPPMVAELYGLFNLTGKATAFVVPYLVSRVTEATQNPRLAFGVVVIFLLAGLIGMSFVREERAVKADA